MNTFEKYFMMTPQTEEREQWEKFGNFYKIPEHIIFPGGINHFRGSKYIIYPVQNLLYTWGTNPFFKYHKLFQNEFPGIAVDKDNIFWIMLFYWLVDSSLYFSFTPMYKLSNLWAGYKYIKDYFHRNRHTLYEAIIEDHIERQNPTEYIAKISEYDAELKQKKVELMMELDAEKRDRMAELDLYRSIYLQDARNAADSAVRDAILLQEIVR